MGGCQDYGPFSGPWYNTEPIIYGALKGTIVLTTTHIAYGSQTWTLNVCNVKALFGFFSRFRAIIWHAYRVRRGSKYRNIMASGSKNQSRYGAWDLTPLGLGN